MSDTQRITIRQNDRTETFVDNIQLPHGLTERQAAALASSINMTLSEMHQQGLLRSCFAKLAEDEAGA